MYQAQIYHLILVSRVLSPFRGTFQNILRNTGSRGLSVDAIEQVNSGHPGLPLGCAEIGAVLFGEMLSCPLYLFYNHKSLLCY